MKDSFVQQCLDILNEMCDIICLQEVSNNVLNMLLEYSSFNLFYEKINNNNYQ